MIVCLYLRQYVALGLRIGRCTFIEWVHLLVLWCV